MFATEINPTETAHREIMAAIVARDDTRLRAALEPITVLDLTDNVIGPDGAEFLSNVLHDHNSLISLRLPANKIGDRGIVALAHNFISVSDTLIELNLKGIHLPGEEEISEQGIQALMEALLANRTCSLRYLNLWGNRIGDQGAAYIAHFLTNNHRLAFIGLGRNGISHEGMVHLSTALTQNHSLLAIDLRFNPIGDEGAMRLATVISSAGTMLMSVGLMLLLTHFFSKSLTFCIFRRYFSITIIAMLILAQNP